jgi:hypothetical protein
MLDIALGAMDSRVGASDELEPCIGENLFGLVDSSLTHRWIANDPS